VNSYAGVLSGAFVRVGGVLVGTRAECSLHQRRLAQQRYVQRHPDVRAAKVVRFRQMRLGYVVLDTPVLVSDTVFTHAILVKSLFCVACVDPSSLKNAEVRRYKGKRRMDVRTLPPAFRYKGAMGCLYRRKKTLRANTTRWVVYTCIVDKSVV